MSSEGRGRIKGFKILKHKRPKEDRWYIMGMIWLHRNPFRKLFASVMVLFFFGSQAFSCCMINREMGDSLKASLAKILPEGSQQSSHACCPSKQASKAPHNGHGDSESNGCCIQDANSKAPQITSEGVLQPPSTSLVIERLLSVGVGRPPTTIARSPSLSFTGPPLYLTHLQLLI